MKYIYIICLFAMSAMSDSLSLKFSPKNYDYLFVMNPEIISQYKMFSKGQWFKDVGLGVDNLKTFAFSADLSKYITLKKDKGARLERIQQWLMFMEYKKAPKLEDIRKKYQEKKAAGNNRMNVEESEINSYKVFMIPFKERVYTYAMISPTQWIAGEKTTITQILSMSESDSLANNQDFSQMFQLESDQVVKAFHVAKDNIEISHPMLQSYKGSFFEVKKNELWQIHFSMNLENEEEAKAVENFVRMMMGFMIAKPNIDIKAEVLKTEIKDGTLSFKMDISPEQAQQLREHIKNKWKYKKKHHKN